MSKLFIIILLLLTLSVFNHATDYLLEDNLILEIFLADNSSFKITSESNKTSVLSNNKQFDVYGQELSISFNSNKIYINNTAYSDQIELLSELPLYYKNNPYNGSFKIVLIPEKKLRLINLVELEDYVSGVITAEIGANAPNEALKAQAVATRTVTISKIINGKHRQENYDLCNSVHCQVYTGLKSQTTQSYRATMETANQILVYDNKVIEAFYSASCGGITENSGNLWLVQHDYLISKIDSYCIDEKSVPVWNKRFINWERIFTKRELENKFQIKNISDIIIKNKNSSMRVEEIEVKSAVKNLIFSGQYEIRSRFDLPSSLFLIKQDGDSFNFIGNGYGHGVGMCQTGTIVRALKGQTYSEILGFYFEGAIINDSWINLNYIK